MAYEGNLQQIPGLSASADLSTKQFYWVKGSATGVALCDTQGEVPLGVLQDKPNALGQEAAVAWGGVTKMVAGAAISIGANIMVTAAGKGITATATNHACGIALEAAAADGDIITVLLAPIGVV